MADKCYSLNCIGTDSTQPVICYCCKNGFHLGCMQIIQSAKNIFVTKNIVFMCDSCLNNGPLSPKRKQSTSTFTQATINTDEGGFSLKRAVSSPQIAVRKKTDDMKELKETIKSLENEIKRNTSVLGELHSSFGLMQGSVEKQQTTVTQLESTVKKSFADVVGPSGMPLKSRILTDKPSSSSQQTTTTKTTSSNKKSTDTRPRSVDEKTKTAIKNRKLMSGNKAVAHEFGVATTQMANKPKPARIELPNSIHVSRCKIDFTAENLVAYIKEQMPSLNTKHVAAHILIPKGKELENLSFVSFRLRCTAELFDQLSSPDFWPSSVFIGEFYDKPKQRKFGDFVQEKIDMLNKSTNGESNEPEIHTDSKNETANTAATDNVTIMDTSMELTNAEKEKIQQQKQQN